MKKIISLLLLSVLSFNVYAVSAAYYGKIENQVYIRINQPTEDIAKQKAKEFCAEKNGDDCKFIAFGKQGGYGAVARNRTSAVSVVFSRTSKQAAIKDVLANCNKYYGGCKITGSFNDLVIFPKEVLEREAAEEAARQAPKQCYGFYGGLRDCNSVYDYGGRNMYTGKYMGEQ